ncbi:MAG: hypothetical protein MR971_07740 [Bacteroidales bacterium]|nr:hypothetical protein [Bacteroidales bacterium]
MSPRQELGPAATPFVVGGVLLAILADRSSRKQNTLDYDVSSRRWSRTTAKAVPGAGSHFVK